MPDRSGQAELWLDYVADLGDGWNSTYTVARLLATEALELDWDGETHRTERGRILVFGGDAVYPVPKAVEYENRMLGPYRSALPCARAEAPELFAIPGSHDWYDGLVNFTSIFCRNRWIGGWRTRQRRSYFALKLPNGWWLWGIDIQFGASVDEVQLQYFADVAADQMQPGDRVVLCMSKEVESGRKQAEVHSDRDVEYLEREIIQPSGARLLLYLKSGKHYYSRYEEEDGPRHHIESGGGGAFLHPTHNLPERTDFPGPDGPTAYRRAGTYPSAAFSKRLRKRIWLMPAYNLPLAAVFGTVQVLLAFMLGLHLDDRHVVARRRATCCGRCGRARRPFCSACSCWRRSSAWCASPTTPAGSAAFCSGWPTRRCRWRSVAGVMLAASYLVDVASCSRASSSLLDVPRPRLAAGRNLGDDGHGRLPVGHGLPRPARHRGLRPPAPPGPEALPAPAHPGRRRPDASIRSASSASGAGGRCAPTHRPTPRGSRPTGQSPSRISSKRRSRSARPA